jgi:hypothetical protein
MFVFADETAQTWEVGRHDGKYIQRCVGKNGKVGRWGQFGDGN